MILKKTDTSGACPFCGVFGCDEEEFCFYAHPNVVPTFIELRRKAQSMDMDGYAEFRGLRTKRGVVMPGYGSLVNAWKWMCQWEEKQREVAVSEKSEKPKTELPF